MIYKQLTHQERYLISVYKSIGFKIKKIASLLGRHPSTIYRELKRNKDDRGCYYYRKAHDFAVEKRKDNPQRALRITESLWGYIEYKLEAQWSREQISHFAGVSYEHIYRYIYKDKKKGGKLHLNLRHKAKKRQRRSNGYRRRALIPNAVSIELRPKIVDSRKRLGDFGVDTIIGANQKKALVSIVERKSGLTFIKKVEHKTASAVEAAIIELLMPIKSKIKTITSDNGREFAHHETIANALDCHYYFAHPYSSWERGTNENTNGLIRQYFPKKMAFDTITDEEVDAVAHRLNQRPRKRLNFKTPYEVFY